jgi:5-methylcytosine-specific restriction endonuclease McrA
MRPDIHYRPTKATIRAKRRKRSLIHHFGEKLAARDGGLFCHYCLIPLVRADPHKPHALEDWRRRGKGIATIDHCKPLSKGGSNKLENLVLACYDCNIKKGDSTYEGFIRSLKLEQIIKGSHQSHQPYRPRG